MPRHDNSTPIYETSRINCGTFGWWPDIIVMSGHCPSLPPSHTHNPPPPNTHTHPYQRDSLTPIKLLTLLLTSSTQTQRQTHSHSYNHSSWGDWYAHIANSDIFNLSLSHPRHLKSHYFCLMILLLMRKQEQIKTKLLKRHKRWKEGCITYSLSQYSHIFWGWFTVLLQRWHAAMPEIYVARVTSHLAAAICTSHFHMLY